MTSLNLYHSEQSPQENRLPFHFSSERHSSSKSPASPLSSSAAHNKITDAFKKASSKKHSLEEDIKGEAKKQKLQKKTPDWLLKFKMQLGEMTKMSSQTISQIISFIERELEQGRWPSDGQTRVYPATTTLPRTIVALGRERVVVPLKLRLGSASVKYVHAAIDNSKKERVALITFRKKDFEEGKKNAEIAINLQLSNCEGIVETFACIPVLPEKMPEEKPLCYQCDLKPCADLVNHAIYNEGLLQPIYKERLDNAIRQISYAGEDLSLKEKMLILHKLIVGLKKIHAAKLAHNDLLPCNILTEIDQDHCLVDVRIADFGEASKKRKHQKEDIFYLGQILFRLFMRKRFLLDKKITFDDVNDKFHFSALFEPGSETRIEYDKQMAELAEDEEIDPKIKTLIKGMLEFEVDKRISISQIAEIEEVIYNVEKARLIAEEEEFSQI